MPRRTDIRKILIIGSDTQACKALWQEGYRVVLVNWNPATIMADSETVEHIRNIV